MHMNQGQKLPSPHTHYVNIIPTYLSQCNEEVLESPSVNRTDDIHCPSPKYRRVVSLDSAVVIMSMKYLDKYRFLKENGFVRGSRLS